MAAIAIVGGDTPLGREVRDRLSEVRIGTSVSVLGSTAGDAVLTEEDDEPAVMTPLEAERLQEADLVICAGDADSTRKAWQMAGRTPGIHFVDLTYALEPMPDARLRSPLTETSDTQPDGPAIHVIANPAASVLALLLLRLQAAFPIRSAVIQVFEPVSERGQAGLTELQQQVMNLLSFRPLEKRVFDAQISFNLLARFGEEAPELLEDIEGRLERHLTSLLRASAPLPSLRLIQAPVFHGHTFSLWIDFESRPEIEDLEAELESTEVEVRGPEVEAPSNVGVAGQSGVITGLIQPDRNHPGAVWIWAVSDNYRVMADNAVAVAQELLKESGN